MSSFCQFFHLVLTILTISLQVHTQEDTFISTDEFTIYNGSAFSLPNIHRNPEPWLRLSLLPNSRITHQELHQDLKTRKFTLNDQSVLRLKLSQVNKNVSEYHFVWSLGKENALNREICVHYGTTGYW